MHKQNTHIVDILTERNPSVDYSYVAIWKNARPFVSDIRTYLSNRFEILLETKIIWSEAYFKQNAARLYEVPLFENREQNPIVDHSHKIGDLEFIIFVLKDEAPKYNYHPSVSGRIEQSNSAVVDAKNTFRSWVEATSNAKYAVHSSTNFEEFCFQIPLLLGVENFKKLVSGEKLDIPILEKDLEGAGGWDTAKAMFAVLNSATKYLVLRNFETLPTISSIDDLDFLTTKYQRLASAMGLGQKATKPYKGAVIIAKKSIPVDIRFVGDNYYCDAWAETLLRHSIFQNAIFVPRTDHYFFSLLYHVVVQKPNIAEHYKVTLVKLAQELRLDWFSAALFLNEQEIVNIVNGYMMANGYFYESPIDEAVFENRKVVSQLPKRSSLVVKKSMKLKIKQTLLRFIPKRWYFYYLKLRTGRPYDSNK